MPRIVLIDDGGEMSELLGPLLVQEGYLVTVLGSGDEALAYAAKSIFPVILFFGSLRLYERIRAQREARLPDVGVILASGAQEVPRFAGVQLLKKPYSIGALLAALKRALPVAPEVPPSLAA